MVGVLYTGRPACPGDSTAIAIICSISLTTSDNKEMSLKRSPMNALPRPLPNCYPREKKIKERKYPKPFLFCSFWAVAYFFVFCLFFYLPKMVPRMFLTACTSVVESSVPRNTRNVAITSTL